MAPAPEFRVLDALLITIPDGPPAACSVPLTFFDVKWLHLPPVERVFLYRLPEDADAAAILSSLKVSLSHALRAFYPFAGHVRRRSDSERHELLYQPGDGVYFTTAEYDVDVQDLSSDDPVLVSAISPLVPQLPKGRAVLAVQATLLQRRRGIALGVTIHHTACDGKSSTHFLHTWAAAAAATGGGGTEVVIDPPVIDRTLIPDPRGLYDTYLKSMPPIARSQELEFIVSKPPPPADVSIATFTLSEEVLQSIKSTVACEAARRGLPTPSRCSSLVAAYGFMWWCHANAHHAHHARAAETTNDDDSRRRRRSYFLFSVDQRARMKPAVPDRYMGNCMCPAIATVPRDEMRDASVSSGLYVACAAVAAAIEEEVGEGAQDRWDGCVARVKDAVANGTLSVAGSPRFRVYDIDFGFGRPSKVHMVSVAKTGAISVADARAGGGRAIELGVSLPPDAMDRFRACFADAMDELLLRK